MVLEAILSEEKTYLESTVLSEREFVNLFSFISSYEVEKF